MTDERLALALAIAHLVLSAVLVVVFLLTLRRQRNALTRAERALGLETAYASAKSAELEHAQRYVGQLARTFAAEIGDRNAARASQLVVTAATWEYDADMEQQTRERVQKGAS